MNSEIAKEILSEVVDELDVSDVYEFSSSVDKTGCIFSINKIGGTIETQYNVWLSSAHEGYYANRENMKHFIKRSFQIKIDMDGM